MGKQNELAQVPKKWKMTQSSHPGPKQNKTPSKLLRALGKFNCQWQDIIAGMMNIGICKYHIAIR
jgi:hypothetical protein